SMGEKIEGLPIGSEPHTTEAWVMIDRPNSTIVAWGNEKAQGKVVMQYRSPSRINMDCYFSGGNIATSRDVPMHTWQHIVYTYSPEATRIYIDGKLIDEGLNRKPVLAIESPARFYVGGWYDRYEGEGIIVELRLSSGALDAAWIHLQHENQKPNSTLCGSLVKKGSANAEPQLKVTPGSLEINEGEIGKVTAIAEGAEKIYWELDRNGTKKIIETDRWSCSIPAGRVTDRETASLTLKAVYQNSIREIVVPIVIQNSIPEPELTAIKTILKGKQSVNANRTEAKLVWDGRSDLILEPIIDNAKALQSQPSHELTYSWTTSGVAVGSRADGERLVLTRAQGNGELTVKASVHNGGPEVSTTTIIRIEQPKRETESWIERPATADERPRDGQFIPRDGWGDAKTRTGTLRYRGVLDADTLQKIKPDRLVLRAFADSKRIAESTV
ncbi:MAG: LamG-like jellyroll fold domain-containing protein, partial [Pirellula sp.]